MRRGGWRATSRSCPICSVPLGQTGKGAGRQTRSRRPRYSWARLIFSPIHHRRLRLWFLLVTVQSEAELKEADLADGFLIGNAVRGLVRARLSSAGAGADG